MQAFASDALLGEQGEFTLSQQSDVCEDKQPEVIATTFNALFEQRIENAVKKHGLELEKYSGFGWESDILRKNNAKKHVADVLGNAAVKLHRA